MSAAATTLSGCAATPDVVVTGGVPAAHAAAYRNLVFDAIPLVEDLWGSGTVPLPVRIDLPLTTGQWATATGYRPDQRGYAASTVRSNSVGGEDPEPVIVIHPGAWSGLSPEGREAIVVHEMTHLAMGGRASTPWWLSEGLAEYTAHRRSSSPLITIAGSALRDAANSPPVSWPTPSPASRAWTGYAQAWLVCVYIAEQYGEKALLRTYRAVHSGVSLNAAISGRLGQNSDRVHADWVKWLQHRNR